MLEVGCSLSRAALSVSQARKTPAFSLGSTFIFVLGNSPKARVDRSFPVQDWPICAWKDIRVNTAAQKNAIISADGGKLCATWPHRCSVLRRAAVHLSTLFLN